MRHPIHRKVRTTSIAALLVLALIAMVVASICTTTVRAQAIPANSAPTLDAIGNQTIDEDAPAQTISLTGIDDGDPALVQAMTITATSSNPALIPNPTVTYTSPNTTGSLSFTPAANANGTAIITVRVTDDGSNAPPDVNFVEQTFTVTVNPVDDPPVANNDVLTTDEDTTASGTLVANDTDSSVLNYELVSNGTLGVATITNPTTGAYTYVPNPNANGIDSFTFHAFNNPALNYDGINDYAIAPLDGTTLTQLTVEMWVRPTSTGNKGIFQWANTSTSPVPFIYFFDANGTFQLYVNSSYQLSTPLPRNIWTHMATTYDGTTWRLYKNGILVGSYIGGSLYQTEAASLYFGQGYHGYWGGQIGEARIWSVARSQAQIAAGISTSALPGTEPGLLTNYRFADGTGSTTAANRVSGGPVATLTNMDLATAWVSYGALGDGNISNTATITVTVNPINDAPTLGVIANRPPINEDSGLQTVNLAGINDGDPELVQTMTLIATSSNPALIPNPTVIYTSPSTIGTLRYTPVANANGTATITVRAIDNGSNIAPNVNFIQRSFTVTVNPVNDAPTLTAVGNVTINEDAGLQTVNLAGINDGDPELNQVLNVTATSSNPALIPNPTVTYTSPGATGSLSFTPAANASGSATITVRVTDDGSNIAPNVNFVQRIFTITVNPVNDAPTLTAIGNVMINEDAPAQTVNLAGIDDGDPELNQVLSVTATSSNPALIPNPTVTYTSPNATGSLSFTPVANASGSAIITVRVTDDGGNTAPDVNFVEQTFTVTVNPVNDPPTGLGLSSSSIAENEPIGTLVGTFSPTDIDGGPTYTYSLVAGTGDTDNASFSISAGELHTAAVFDYETQTSYSIRVAVDDGNGGIFATNFTISITNVSLAPLITSTPPLAGQSGQSYSHTFVASGDPVPTFTFTGNLPNGLSLSASGVLSGTPTQTGSFPITVTADNGISPAASQVFTLSILPIGQTTCSSADLQAVFNQPGPVMNLDGTCRYLLNDLTGTNGHIVNLYSRSNLIINGNGAIIERTSSAGDLGIIALIDNTNVTIQNLTLIGGRATANTNQLGGRGGGILLYNSSNITLIGVQFYGNSATLGGGLSSYGGSTNLYSSVLADNQALANGAGFYAQGPATVLNTTITSSTPNAKEAMFAWNALTLKNTILSNHAVGIAAAGGTNPVNEDYNLFSDLGQTRKTYNTGTIITGGAASFTSPTINQHFVNPATHDYRLKVSSPAIDRGTLVSATLDADGHTRPFGNTAVDIGAYEFQGDGALSIRKIGPHWVDAGATFTYEIVVANNGAALSNLQIRDVLPSGVSFVGGATGGGSFDGTMVRWDVANLAPQQTLSLSYQARTSQSVINTDYTVVRQSDGAILASGQQLETLVNTTQVLYLQNSKQHSFVPGAYGFNFANWRESASGADLTTASMYTLYGPNVCASGTSASAQSCVLSATAQQQLQNLLTTNTNGRMFGMVAASLKLFLGEPLADGRTTPSDYQPGAALTFDLLRYADLQHVIGLYQAGRSSTPQNGASSAATNGTPGGLVSFLLANGFDGPTNNDAYTLSIRKRNGSGALALLPYALEYRNSGIYWLYVYDPSSPADQTRIIVIDTTSDTWSYTSAGQTIPGYVGDVASTSIFLRSLAADTSMPRACGFCGSSGAASDQMTYGMNGTGRLLITNGSGQRTGYDPVTDTYINEIPSASLDYIESDVGLDLPPIIRVPLGGRYTTALFSLPNGAKITQNGAPTSLVGITLTAPGMIAGLRDLTLDGPSDPAQFTVDYQHRMIGFQPNLFGSSGSALDLAITQADGTSYRFVLTGVELSQGSSVAIGFDPTTGKLSLSDTDTGRTQRYDLTILRVQSGGASQTFQRLDVTGGRGAGAEIDFNGWSGLGWPPTAILPNLVSLSLVVR